MKKTSKGKKATYAICEACGKEMAPGNGCGLTHARIGSEEYERIKVGDDLDFEPGTYDFCHDCNAGPGQYHHYNCDAERCPCCNEQFFGCDCKAFELYCYRKKTLK